jgi:Spy/CpxP family protein refolding chaperone
LIATTVLTGVALAGWAYSQTAPSGKPCHRGKSAGWMLEKLNLTAEQQTQVKDIMQQAKTDAASAADRQAKHDIWKAAREKINTTVLTQAQRDQLPQMRTECKWHHAPASQPAVTG